MTDQTLTTAFIDYVNLETDAQALIGQATHNRRMLNAVTDSVTALRRQLQEREQSQAEYRARVEAIKYRRETLHRKSIAPDEDALTASVPVVAGAQRAVSRRSIQDLMITPVDVDLHDNTQTQEME